MKTVILDGYTLNPGDLTWEDFYKFGEVEIYDRTSDDEVVKRIGNADAVFTKKVPMTRNIIEQCKNIKFIGVLATGYNLVDIEAADEKGIIVSNIPTYGTQAVAQFTIALLLEVCHHIGDHFNAVKNGQWTNSPDFCFWNYPLIELAGKTMGIIGFGRIGQHTAKIAQAMGMNIIAFSKNHDSKFEKDNIKFVSLDELLEKSDVISLHCPLFQSTKGIINKNTISKMKDGVIIINSSRGPLIVEEDLRDALNSGKVAGAACDVVSTESITMDSPLLQAKNIIITPHIAWAPRESRQRLMELAADNLRAFLNGKPQNVVNAVNM